MTDISIAPPSLQDIHYGSVINLTVFGHAFRQRCRQEDMYNALPDYGFFDGGCLSLALAVQSILGTDVARIRFVGRITHLDHAVVELAIDGTPHYLDADGLATATDLLTKMKHAEGLSGPITIKDGTLEEAAAVEVVDGNNASRTLKDLLRPFFSSHPVISEWLKRRDPDLIARHHALADEESELDVDASEALLSQPASTPGSALPSPFIILRTL